MKNKIDELKRFAPNFIFSTISITQRLPRGGCGNKRLDQVGFEPTTYSLQASRSSNWSYKPIKAGLLSIKHPIGSEFHIITHNELINLTILGIFLS